jgi:acetyl esterase/lipase
MSSGGAKYGHLSIIDPEFAAIKPAHDAFTAKIWSLPLNQIRAMVNTPLEYPDFVPSVDDLVITEKKVPVSDGTEIGIKIYKQKSPVADAVLYYVMHGGGWVVGSHGIEEVMNRSVAKKNGAVVVSVDYRM